MNYEYNTHIIKKMNMPFTITFVKREFFDILVATVVGVSADKLGLTIV